MGKCLSCCKERDTSPPEQSKTRKVVSRLFHGKKHPPDSRAPSICNLPHRDNDGIKKESHPSEENVNNNDPVRENCCCLSFCKRQKENRSEEAAKQAHNVPIESRTKQGTYERVHPSASAAEKPLVQSISDQGSIRKDVVKKAAGPLLGKKGKPSSKEPRVPPRWIRVQCALVRNEWFSDYRRVPNSDPDMCLKGRNLHLLLDKLPTELTQPPTASRIQSATEFDFLCPGVLDGPPIRLSIHTKLQFLDSFARLLSPAMNILRLPRFETNTQFGLDDFFIHIAQNSSNLRELMFEDSGQISTRSASVILDRMVLKKLEIFDPRSPSLRALTIGCTQLEEVCFHSLAPASERDLCLFLREKGDSLKALRLGFCYSVRVQTPSKEQKDFWGRVLATLDELVPTELSELQMLELSACPSYEVKHSFSAAGSTSNVPADRLLNRVDAIIRKKERVRHPKESEISLSEIKLRGHLAAITDSLGALTWVNQDAMEIVVELPGVTAVYPRGFGMMKPVVLPFVQLDEFIFEGSTSAWLDVTALKEVDLGEANFVQLYNTGFPSIKEDTRRLLMTSRESLARIRIAYRMPTRDVFISTRNMLGQMATLAPLVKHLDISRDVVLYADIEDNEYVHTIMTLRRWNLKTVQLVSPRNYGRIQDSVSAEHRSFSKFLKRLPAFLPMLACACPRLENVILEYEEVEPAWGGTEPQAREMIAGAMRAVKEYEAVVSTVDICSVLGQLRMWERGLAEVGVA